MYKEHSAPKNTKEEEKKRIFAARGLAGRTDVQTDARLKKAQSAQFSNDIEARAHGYESLGAHDVQEFDSEQHKPYEILSTLYIYLYTQT